MYRLKHDKQDVQIVLRGKGVLDKKNIMTPAGQMLAQMIMNEYPQYRHNLVEVGGRKEVSDPMVVDVELKKKGDMSLIFQNQKSDGQVSSSKERELPLELNVSKPSEENQ